MVSDDNAYVMHVFDYAQSHMQSSNPPASLLLSQIKNSTPQTKIVPHQQDAHQPCLAEKFSTSVPKPR